MALPYKYTGFAYSRSRGVIDAIEKQLKRVTLKPTKKLSFSFNPFDEGVVSIRSAAQHLYEENIRETNYKCSYRTVVHNTSAEPILEVNLVSGHSVIFKTRNLTTLEILEKFNEIISSQHKEEEKKA